MRQLRYKSGKESYIVFIRPNPSRRDSFMQTDCDCGFEPALHYHRAYKKRGTM